MVPRRRSHCCSDQLRRALHDTLRYKIGRRDPAIQHTLRFGHRHARALFEQRLLQMLRGNPHLGAERENLRFGEAVANLLRCYAARDSRASNPPHARCMPIVRRIVSYETIKGKSNLMKTYKVGIASLVHDHIWSELNHWKALPNAEVVAAYAESRTPVAEVAASR